MIQEKVELIFTDLVDNHNKFWRGILHDNGDVITEWGRVGYNQQSKNFPGKGKNFLDKKVREKIDKGYTPTQTLDGTAGSIIVPSNNELHTIAKQQLIKKSNPVLENLIKQLVQANVHRITSNTQLRYNASTGLFTTPLGIVTLEAIEEARKYLDTISILVTAKKTGTPELFGVLSSYLRLIPQNIGATRNSAQYFISSTTDVEKQSDLLDALKASYLAATNQPQVSDSPVEKVFAVDLDVESGVERNRLNKWFEESKKKMHGYDNIHIQNVYSVNIHTMTSAFDSSLGNVTEVFHGTSQANCLSILKSGLQVAPPSTAAIAGKMFGNGIYGAIHSTKSLGYTFGRWGQGSTGTGWLFVCDFAMGKYYEAKSATQPKPGYDSIWAKAGQSLYHDELIVYKNNQVKIKYLLECR